MDFRRPRHPPEDPLPPPVSPLDQLGDREISVWLVRLLGVVVVAGLILGLAAVISCRASRTPGQPDPVCDAIPQHVVDGFNETLQTIVTLLAGSRLTGPR